MGVSLSQRIIEAAGFGGLYLAFLAYFGRRIWRVQVMLPRRKKEINPPQTEDEKVELLQINQALKDRLAQPWIIPILVIATIMILCGVLAALFS